MIERGFDHAFNVLVIGSRLIYTAVARREIQRIAALVFKVGFIDILGIGFGELVGNLLFLIAESAAGRAHHPLVRRIGCIEIRDRTPAHRACHRVADAFDRADRGKIIIIKLAVACRAYDGRLRSSSAHTKGEDTLGVACDHPAVVTDIAYSGFQIHNACGRSVITSATTCVNINEALISVIGNIRVVRQCLLRGIAGSIDRHNNRRSCCCIAANGRVAFQRAGIGTVTVIRSFKIICRNKHSELFIAFIGRVGTIGNADLIINLVAGIVLPLCHIDFAERCAHFFCRRGSAALTACF